MGRSMRARASLASALLVSMSCGGAISGGGGGETILAAAFPATPSWLEGATVLTALTEEVEATLVVRNLTRLQALFDGGDGGDTAWWLAVLDEPLGVHLGSAAEARACGIALDQPVAIALLPGDLVAVALPIADAEAFARAYDARPERALVRGAVAIIVGTRGVGFGVAGDALARRLDAALTPPAARTLAKSEAFAAITRQASYAPDAVLYLPQRGLRALILGDLAEDAGAESDRDMYGGQTYGDTAAPSEATVARWREEWGRWGVTLTAVAIGVDWTDPGAIAFEATGAIDDRGVAWATAKGVAVGVEALLAVAARREQRTPPRKPSSLRGRHSLVDRLLASGAPLAVYPIAAEPTKPRDTIHVGDSEELATLRRERQVMLDERTARELHIARGLGEVVGAGSAVDGVPRLRGGLFFAGTTRTALADQLRTRRAKDDPASPELTRLRVLDEQIAALENEGVYHAIEDGYETFYDEGAFGGVEGGVIGGVVGGIADLTVIDSDPLATSIEDDLAKVRYRVSTGVITIDGADQPAKIRASLRAALETVESACTPPGPAHLAVTIVLDGADRDITVAGDDATSKGMASCVRQAFLSELADSAEQGKVAIKLQLAYEQVTSRPTRLGGTVAP